MKKWPFVVAGLYGLTLLALLGPLLLIAFFDKSAPQKSITDAEDFLRDLPAALVSLESLWIWVPIGVMVLAQFALLRVPVCLANRRPVTQRPLLTTVIAAAFMMGLLVFGAAASLWELFTKADALDNGFWVAGAVGIGSWVFWLVYFKRATNGTAPDAKLAGLRRYLWTGSILELLVAIPTHILARHRDYCCAGIMTFIGLTCGIAVMLFAFGPAVYFLFVERWKRLHPNHDSA